MKCIKLDGQASCQPNHGMTCPVFLIIFDWSNDWRPERHVIGCLPPEVLAPSPGTKSLDGNFSVGDGTSKFWVEDVLNSQRHCTYLYSFKKSVVFPLSWIFLIVYRKPKKIYARHAQLGSGQRLRAARRNRKLKGSKSWICPSLFQPSRGGQCAVLVVLLMSHLCWNNKNDECMVCIKII